MSAPARRPGLQAVPVIASAFNGTNTRLIDADFGVVLGANQETGSALADAAWVFWGRSGTVFAQRLDTKARRLTGEPIHVADGVFFNSFRGALSTSPTGQVAYRIANVLAENSIDQPARHRFHGAVAGQGARRALTVSGDNRPMSPEAERARERAGRITLRRFASMTEADRHDLEFWQQIPAADRILQVWRLSQEQWQLGDQPVHESGLCRSVASVHRR